MSVDRPDQNFDDPRYGRLNRPRPHRPHVATFGSFEMTVRPTISHKSKTHCPVGRSLLAQGNKAEAAKHKYSGANLGTGSHGSRICRYCASKAGRAFRARAKLMKVAS